MPLKKCKYNDILTPTKELSSIQQSTINTRTDINSVSKQVKVISIKLNSIRKEVRKLKRYSYWVAVFSVPNR
jgi:peptidoglycan hydrolase CwlO-like protein